MDMKCAEKVVAEGQRQIDRMTYIALECGASATRMGRMMGVSRQRIYQRAQKGGVHYEEEQADEAEHA